ncbi:pyridoxamine 5'-phosphate oxidase family protein, partial [bacterium]|nr:pyridoxamine 5'-phosphate oxidase family protein [bacterium]
VNSNRILFPDYSGNKMFNTLGNITVNPNAGLLFLDFKNGNTLQLTGKARVIWEEERIAEFAGAERLIEFDIEQVIEITAATNLSWSLLSYSPSNPANIF